MKKFLVLATTLLTLSNSYAANTDYYLDAVNGNNSWSGTSPDNLGCNPECIGPWKTMDAVEAYSDPSLTVGFEQGDKILFNKGDTFIATTGLVFEDSGVQGNPITFSSYGSGAQPVLQMSGWQLVGSLWTDMGDGIWFHSYAGQAVAGFWEDGIHLRHASDSGLTDGEFFWEKDTGIYYEPPVGTTPDDHDLYRTGAAYGIAINNLKHLEFSDLHFTTGPHAIGGSAMDSPIENILIENCQFDNLTTPIFIMSRNLHENRNITVRNNTFNSSRRAITIQSAGNGKEHNYNINITGNSISDLDSNGNYLSFLEDAGRSRDNEAITGQNFMNSSVTDNYIVDGDKAVGISMWTNSESRFDNNIFARNVIHEMAVGITLFSSNTLNTHSGNRIYQNVIYDCTHNDEMSESSLVGAMRLSGNDAINSNLVYNNTIGDCGTSFYLSAGEGFTLNNNLSFNPGNRHIWLYGYAGSDASVGILNNNLYFPVDEYGTRFRHTQAQSPKDITFNQWKDLTQQDGSTLIDDPQLESGVGDFRLSSTSPAIDAGVNLGLDTDLDGDPITGFPDIGAYEY